MDAEEVKRDIAVVTKWYQEAPNVVSSTRIFTAILIGIAAAWILIMMLYVIVCLHRGQKPDAATLQSMAEPLAALVPSGAVAIYARNKGA